MIYCWKADDLSYTATPITPVKPFTNCSSICLHQPHIRNCLKSEKPDQQIWKKYLKTVIQWMVQYTYRILLQLKKRNFQYCIIQQIITGSICTGQVIKYVRTVRIIEIEKNCAFPSSSTIHTYLRKYISVPPPSIPRGTQFVVTDGVSAFEHVFVILFIYTTNVQHLY